jgi:hypothetical protein
MHDEPCDDRQSEEDIERNEDRIIWYVDVDYDGVDLVTVIGCKFW